MERRPLLLGLLLAVLVGALLLGGAPHELLHDHGEGHDQEPCALCTAPGAVPGAGPPTLVHAHLVVDEASYPDGPVPGAAERGVRRSRAPPVPRS